MKPPGAGPVAQENGTTSKLPRPGGSGRTSPNPTVPFANSIPHSASASSELCVTPQARPDRLSPLHSTLKQQLLNPTGPGNYLSRSQDSLYGSPVDSISRQKQSIPGHATIGKTRPQSSLGVPNKFGGVGTRNNGRSSGSRTAPSTPVNVVQQSSPAGRSVGSGISSSAHSTICRQRKTASQQADARITKTKVTVTELEKARQELESQLSDLTKKADTKQAEIAQLKMELRRANERASDVEKLKAENEQLRNAAARAKGDSVRLLDSECDSPILVHDNSAVDVGTSPLPYHRRQDGGSGSSDQGADNDCDIQDPLPEWDRQSNASQLSEISVACLQDKIAVMEETHYSTSEELQATLEELTDLQEIVHEIAKENQQMSEENKTLSDGINALNTKSDQYRLQIENLKHLVLSGGEFRSSSKSCGGDRDQKLIDLLKTTHEEHEDLKCKYVEIHNALGVAQEEMAQRAEMAGVFKDRNRILELQLDSVSEERRSLETEVMEIKKEVDRDRREIHRLSLLNEKERCKTEELQRQTQAATKGELESLLEFVRKEKDRAEERCTQLEEALAIQKHEREKDRDRTEAILKDLNSAEEAGISLSKSLQDKEAAENDFKEEIRDLRSALEDLEERSRRHLEEKTEYKANILTMQEHIEALTGERDRLRKEMGELREQGREREEEWRQFQSDLQVAVVVANDFKMEAQTDIERLSDENAQLRNKIETLCCDMERMRQARKANASPVKLRSSSVNTGQSAEIRNRADQYMRLATGAETPSIGISTGNRNIGRTAHDAKGLSVKDMIETMEHQKALSPSANLESPILTLRDRSPLMRSPGSSRQALATSPGFAQTNLRLGSLSSPSNGAPEFPAVGGLSKSSTSLTGTGSNTGQRPTSLDSVNDLLKAPRLRTAQILVSVPEGSPAEKRKAGSSPSSDDSAGGSMTTTPLTSRPRGILVQKTPSPSVTAHKKAVYLDENKDPLARLLKDAPRGSRRNALLKWCQSITYGYENVEITNFSSSWNDGLAFCALIHFFLPNEIPFAELDSKDKRRNFTLAFKAGEKAGVPTSLSVEEMVSLERPDWSSVMAYVTDIYQHFESFG